MDIEVFKKRHAPPFWIKEEVIFCMEHLSNIILANGEKNYLANSPSYETVKDAALIHDTPVRQHVNSWQMQLQRSLYI